MTRQATARKVLQVLADAHGPLRRMQVQRLADGTSLSSVRRIVAALVWLEEQGWCERAYDPYSGTSAGKWRVTQAGREQLAMTEPFYSEGETA